MLKLFQRPQMESKQEAKGRHANQATMSNRLPWAFSPFIAYLPIRWAVECGLSHWRLQILLAYRSFPLASLMLCLFTCNSNLRLPTADRQMAIRNLTKTSERTHRITVEDDSDLTSGRLEGR